MTNCFIYTYKTLARLGYDVPKSIEFTYNTEEEEKTETFSMAKDAKKFISDFQFFLDNKIHYAFFESFCDYVDKAEKNDIIISDDGIGIAVDKYRFTTTRDRNGLICLDDIRDKKVMRVRNG